jgi:hypothetical protein
MKTVKWGTCPECGHPVGTASRCAYCGAEVLDEYSPERLEAAAAYLRRTDCKTQ